MKRPVVQDFHEQIFRLATPIAWDAVHKILYIFAVKVGNILDGEDVVMPDYRYPNLIGTF